MKNRLHEIIESKGLIKSWVADQAGINRSSLHKIESNKMVPSVRAAIKLAIVLDVDVEDIFIIEPSDW